MQVPEMDFVELQNSVLHLKRPELERPELERPELERPELEMSDLEKWDSERRGQDFGKKKDSDFVLEVGKVAELWRV